MNQREIKMQKICERKLHSSNRIQVSQKDTLRTYPTLGKGKSSTQNAHVLGDMFVPWRVEPPPPPRTRRTSSRDPNRSLELGRSRELGRSVTARVVARGIRALLLALAPFLLLLSARNNSNLPTVKPPSHGVQVT